MKYDNRINKLRMDIESLELQIASAVHQRKPAFAKRLNIILESQKQKLEKWLNLS